MSRVPPLEVDKLTPEQKRVYDQIAGNRKTVRGPFPIMLRNRRLAEHANQFGIALRDNSIIGRQIFELAVITVCRAWKVQYAWSSHSRAGRGGRRGVRSDRRDPRQQAARLQG